MQRNTFRVPIRIGLVLGVVALVLLTALLVHAAWWSSARRNVSSLALQLSAQQLADASGRMSALLDEAATAQQTLADYTSGPTFRRSDPAEWNSLFLAVMADHLAFAAIEFGGANDGVISVRRRPDGSLATARANSDAPASSQFWFKQAFETAGASWSDIYPMADDGALGFTVESAIQGRRVAPGALAVSMRLSQIAAFLAALRTTNHSEIFLTNGYGELVAVRSHAAAPAMTPMRGLVRLSESAAPLIRQAAAELEHRSVSLATLSGPVQFVVDTHPGRRVFVTLAPLTQMGLVIGMVTPEADVLGSINRNTERLAYGLLGFVGLVALSVAIVATRTLANPLIAVTRNAELLGDFRFEDIREAPSPLSEIGALSRAIGQMSSSLASFKKYVPTEIVRTLFAQGKEAELGGERRELTIFFMDLVNFTSLSESLKEALIPFLGAYLSEMSDVVKAGGGTIDKYIGDAVMAFWGAPQTNEAHALRACRAALACQARLRALRESGIGAHRDALRARIGINTGDVLVGNIGSRDRLNYTVIGDPVNVASRLESVNKRYGGEILIGEETFRRAKAHIVARRLDRVAVYGKKEGVEIFELLGLSENLDSLTLQWTAAYEEGLAAMRRHEWNAAESLFARVIALRGADAPSSSMLARIEKFRVEPPESGWDGLLLLSEK